MFHAIVEKSADISRSEATQMRELGIDPKSKKPVFARVGRFGPMIQIGTKDDEEKPAFASIPSSMGVKSINLEQALALFNLPRIVGKTAEGEEILANNGRYGPYLQFDGTYVSLPKTEDPITITLETARELIAAKKLVDAPAAVSGTLLKVVAATSPSTSIDIFSVAAEPPSINLKLNLPSL